jgi:CRP-like cAMP-binding protein
MATPAASIRNIDFEALRALRDRHGAVYPKGRVIFRHGDTSPEFYVVLQGSVELSLTDKESGVKQVLHVAPPGDFFGEMSCFGGDPRSATAIANEDNTVLLQFNQETAIQLLRASPRFTLGVIQRLCDRVNIANRKISELTGQLAGGGPPAPGPAGATLAATAAAAARAAAAATKDVPAPEFDRQQFTGKQIVCPVSGTRFTVLTVRPEATKLQTRESDFHEIYSGPSPLWYLVHVCPECFFAAYPDEFANVPPTEVAALKEQTSARQRLVEGRELAGQRTAEDAVIALRLAVDSYLQRGTNPQRTGGLYHRLAWLSRELGDTQNEQRYLAESLKQYQIAMETARPTEPTAELMMLYTLGELNIRLGNPAEGVRFLHQASQLPAFKLQPEIQRLTRDRWSEARAMAARARA